MRLAGRAFATLLLVAGCASPPSATAPTPPWARPLRPERIERTPARLARGRYLAEGLLQCAICHSERDWTLPEAPPRRGLEYAGQVMRDDSLARIVAPNLTPDRSTGAGAWTDDMLARAIREGVGHDGRALHPQMWYRSFRALSEEDVASVVVYLRSLRPVTRALPATRLTDSRRHEIESSLSPLRAPVPMPDTTDPVARGRYFVRLADCAGCHTSWYTERNPGMLAGGNRIERDSLHAFSTNITPDVSGIGAWPPGTFAGVIRSGKGGGMSPLMPWVVFRNLSLRDLEAIEAFLRTMPAASHLIDNTSSPTRCAACGQDHGLGDQNHLVRPHGIALPARALRACVGTYRSDEFGFTRTVSLEGSRLFGREEQGPAIELVPVSERRFLAPGWLAPVEFLADTSGRVTAMRSIEVDSVVLSRVR